MCPGVLKGKGDMMQLGTEFHFPPSGTHFSANCFVVFLHKCVFPRKHQLLMGTLVQDDRLAPQTETQSEE